MADKKGNLMAEPKTKLTNASVADYLNASNDEQVRQDCWTIADIMEAATKAKPRMWGRDIVGLGSYRYVYVSGREADWPLIAFSPRKQNITLYIVDDFEPYGDLLAKLGKHTRGKVCLYIKRLTDVNLPT